MKWLLSVWTTLLFLIFFSNPSSAKTEVIKFPEGDLASESVLPIFDKPEAVKKRNIVTSKRFELGAFGGWAMNDAFFSPINGGIFSTYHFTEVHAFQVVGAIYVSDTSTYAKQLFNDPTLNLDFKIVPQPKFSLIGAYEYTPFYGKMSITKQFVMNLSIYGVGGAGAIMIGNKMYPAISLGFGEKMYFSKKVGLKIDLRALMYQGIDPLSVKLAEVHTPYDQSAYKNHFIMNLMASVGFFVLL